MPRYIVTEEPSKDVRRYLRHWTDEGFVLEAVARRHPGLAAERRRAKARTISFTVGQGLEYLDSADGSSMLTRPLPLFYASENFAKAFSVLADAGSFGPDFKAHGLTSDQKRRYSIANLRATIAGPGRDVWSRFARLANVNSLAIEFTRDGQPLIGERSWRYPPPAPGYSLLLGDLIRHLPEIADDVRTARWGHSYTARAFNYRIVENTEGSPPTISLSFMAIHRHDPELRALIIRREADVLRGYTRGLDALDAIEYHGSGAASTLQMPKMVADTFGAVHFDFSGGRLALAEPVIHHAALFILSSAVRYMAEDWKRLVDDHPAEAILIDRYLDLASRKVPNLALNLLTETVYSFRFAH